MRLRAPIAVLSAFSLVALALAGCSIGGSSSGSGSSSSGGSGASNSSGGSSGSTAATATFTGDLTGTIAMNICTDSGADSIFVMVKGDSTKYSGVVSKDGVGFLGPEAKAWARALDKNSTLPTPITSGSGGWSVDGVHVYYLLPGATTQEITLSGKLLCP